MLNLSQFPLLYKSLTETKQFTYTHSSLTADTVNVCNQFSKANTQFDTIMDAAIAVAVDTTRVDAINLLYAFEKI